MGGEFAPAWTSPLTWRPSSGQSPGNPSPEAVCCGLWWIRVGSQRGEGKAVQSEGHPVPWPGPGGRGGPLRGKERPAVLYWGMWERAVHLAQALYPMMLGHWPGTSRTSGHFQAC